MSGATAWRGSNMAAFLARVAGEAGVPCELGHGEDARLTQPDRITWEPVERSGRVRECVVLYEDMTVIWERSMEYDVRLRGIDERAARELETSLFNAFVTLGHTPPALEISDGDIGPFSTAAEQGALIVWRIRVWEPIPYARLRQGHIATTTTGVAVKDQQNVIVGGIP